jgi:tetraacyldisaccharide 4'-kinase
VLVGKNRVNSCRLAVSRFSPDIILLDDGFQHRRLDRDIDIVLLDSKRPFGNTFLLPRGSLREPPDALSRAHILVFTRCHDDLPDPSSMLPASVRSKPVFFSRNIPYIHDVTGPPSEGFDLRGKNDPRKLKGARVFAFSAIADNRDFHGELTNLGCDITGKAEFADHHAYSPGEIEDIGQKALASGAEIMATTQKDFYKLPRNARWSLPVVILGVLPAFFGEEDSFDEFMEKAVAEKTRRHGK